jgi:hypothetical protein
MDVLPVQENYSAVSLSMLLVHPENGMSQAAISMSISTIGGSAFATGRPFSKKTDTGAGLP